jgi:hypothetical protein
VATQKPVKPVNPHHLTAKQLSADRSNLSKARAAAHVKPRTAKQKAASRHNLNKARAVQKARRSGKTPVAAKKPQAPLDLPAGGNIHLLPACAPVALAEHLAWQSGVYATVDEILALHRISSGQLTLDGLLELAAAEGFAGMRLESFQRCDPDLLVPGWIYGLDTRGGYHAALAHPAGMVSWGSLLPWPGAPREAWHLTWAPLS